MGLRMCRGMRMRVFGDIFSGGGKFWEEGRFLHKYGFEQLLILLRTLRSRGFGYFGIIGGSLNLVPFVICYFSAQILTCLFALSCRYLP